jgi:hypothetical protein
MKKPFTLKITKAGKGNSKNLDFFKTKLWYFDDMLITQNDPYLTPFTYSTMYMQYSTVGVNNLE